MTSGFELASLILTACQPQSVRHQPGPNVALSSQGGGGGFADCKNSRYNGNRATATFIEGVYAQRVHSTGRNWVILGQLAIFLPTSVNLKPIE